VLLSIVVSMQNAVENLETRLEAEFDTHRGSDPARGT
jgi:hypothetical protein